MPTRSVTLQSDRSEHDRHRTWASLHADGGLTIEGQDLGSGVEEFWGAGNTEYEWAESIQSQDVAKLVTSSPSTSTTGRRDLPTTRRWLPPRQVERI